MIEITILACFMTMQGEMCLEETIGPPQGEKTCEEVDFDAIAFTVGLVLQTQGLPPTRVRLGCEDISDEMS